MSRLVIALLLVLAGCTCDPFTVKGGTQEQRSVAQSVLGAFRRDALPFEVCDIDLVSDPRTPREPVLGYYNAATRNIRVEPEPASGDFPRLLRHELCHAVDLQNDISRRAALVWPLDPTGDIYHETPRRRLDEEGFATWCEIGPEALALGERQEAIALMESTFPDVPRETISIERGAVGTWDVPEGHLVVGHAPSPRDDGVFEFEYVTLDLSQWSLRALEVTSCTEMQANGSWTLLPPDMRLPEPWVTGSNQISLPGYTELTSGWLTLPDGSVSQPWFAIEEGAWVRVDDGAETTHMRGVMMSDGVGYGIESDEWTVSCWPWRYE